MSFHETQGPRNVHEVEGLINGSFYVKNQELVRLRTLAKVGAAHVIPSGHESDPVHRGFDVGILSEFSTSFGPGITHPPSSVSVIDAEQVPSSV